jgi:hypothetical protein
MARARIDVAIDALCDAVPYGHLMADTDPAALIEEATRLLVECRTALEAWEQWRKRYGAVHPHEAALLALARRLSDADKARPKVQP